MSSLKIWLQAFRLRTLPLAFASIVLGSLLAASDQSFDGAVFTLCLITTLFLQVLSNLANDYGDATSGVDGSQRTGPARTVSAGLITKSEMKLAVIITSLLSLGAGVLLILLALGDQSLIALVFLILGVGAIAAAIKYTVGKNPYGYAGFGDFFVLLFFGFVGVCGTYYLHTLRLDVWILLPALSCGLLSVGVLNVNNIRDIVSDKAAGKNSLPVRLGRTNAVIYHYMLLVSAVISALVFVIGQDPEWYAFLFLLVLPLFWKNAMAVKTKTGAHQLDPYLRQLALTTLLFVLLLGLGQLNFWN